VTLVTGGTDNHLVVADVSSFKLNGRQAESALRQANIVVNRNALPFDAQGAWYTSGIRLGTPALTTLGMGSANMKQVAHWITEVLKNAKPDSKNRSEASVPKTITTRIKDEISKLKLKHPLYPDIKLKKD
jgi:glycine hydroxymethyltransferase